MSTSSCCTTSPADRLAVVGGLAERILRKQGFGGRLRTTTSLDDAVDGAAAVLIQLRVGGQQARLVDETLPGKFDLLGQETTGPGGFAKALRTVPVVLGIADTVRERGRPGRVDRRLHQSGRHRHPGAARRRATARSGCATSRSGSSAGWPPDSASTPIGCGSTTPG